MNNYQLMKQKTYFTELESLRGIAAVLVCLYHARYWIALKNLPFILNFDLFVDFFFVLSGFVIALNFSKSIANISAYSDYLTKRFLRLYPLFFAASIPYFVTSVLKTYFNFHSFDTSNYFKLNEFLAYISLTSKWGVVDKLIFNHPSWSISVEFFLYIISGILFMTSKNRTVNIIISVLLSLISLTVLMTYGNGMLNTTGSLSIFRGILSFFIGVIIYYSFNTANTSRIANTPFIQNIYLFATLGLVSGAFILINTNPMIKFVFPLIWAGVIYLVISNRYPSWLINFLKIKSIVYIGTISYSIYLIHPLMIFVTEKILKKSNLQNNMIFSVGGVALYLMLIFFIAGLTFTYIEGSGKSIYKRLKSTNPQKDIAVSYNLK